MSDVRTEFGERVPVGGVSFSSRTIDWEMPRAKRKCRRPREGWKCSKARGHRGPCPATPTRDYVNGYIDALAWAAGEVKRNMRRKKYTRADFLAELALQAEIMSK